MTLTSGEFDSSLFALANGADFEKNEEHKTPHVLTDFVDAAGTITISDKPEAGDVHINSMEVTTSGTPSAGIAVYTASTGVLKFHDDYKAEEIEITYFMKDEDAVTLQVSNDRSAIAEATLVWPKHKWAA